MQSPYSDKPMELQFEKMDMTFRGETFTVTVIFYCCPESKEKFTTTETDTLNLYQLYQQYAVKHNMPIEEVMPKKEIKEEPFISVQEFMPPKIECPKCNNIQTHTYPMSGILTCDKCGTILDSIEEEELTSETLSSLIQPFDENTFLTVDKNGQPIKLGDILVSNIDAITTNYVHPNDTQEFGPVDLVGKHLVCPYKGSYLLNAFVAQYCSIK